MLSVGEIASLFIGIVAFTSIGGSWKQSCSWEITINGNKFASGQLSSRQKRVVSVPLNNGMAKVVIDQGKINVPRMDRHICPKGICTEMGPIFKSGEQIVCLPNKMLVKII